jgi:hypothetical protein
MIIKNELFFKDPNGARDAVILPFGLDGWRVPK